MDSDDENIEEIVEGKRRVQNFFFFLLPNKRKMCRIPGVDAAPLFFRSYQL